ncbi:MAG: hypothetical protein ACK42K_06265 [Leptonema sp. (in: bacteria)]
MNGIYAVFYVFYRKHLKDNVSNFFQQYPIIPSPVRIFLSIFFTYFLFSFAAISFRAYNFDHSYILYKDIFTNWVWNVAGKLTPDLLTYGINILRIVFPVLILDYFRWKNDDPEWIFKTPFWVQLFVFLLLYYIIIINGVFGKDVIYFAF